MRLAISHCPASPELQKIKKAANILKRTHPAVPALRNPEERERAYKMIEEEYVNGQFLIDNLGASRYIYLIIAATLLVVRRKIIEDMQIKSATGYMLLDNILTAQYNTYKLQRVLGDVAIHLESEFFQGGSLGATLKE